MEQSSTLQFSGEGDSYLYISSFGSLYYWFFIVLPFFFIVFCFLRLFFSKFSVFCGPQFVFSAALCRINLIFAVFSFLFSVFCKVVVVF